MFGTPYPEDGGANPNGNPDAEPLPLPNTAGDGVNDGDLFCSDQVQLADGRILAVGGTDWYNDPAIPGTDLGVVELAGLKNARIFDPATDQWSQSGSMSYARWYPSLVTLPDGKVLVASGVSKLVKPIYPDRPFDSGTNVKQLELYDPATGVWTQLPESANRSLPLFPRLHLLPNGHVYYDVAGQSFNPFGQAYDEALWNIGATFDPASNRWNDLGVPGTGLGALPGSARPAAAHERRPQRDPAAQQPAPRRPADPRRRPRPRLRVPGLDVLGHAAADPRRERQLHPGVVPHRGRDGRARCCRLRARSSAPTAAG